MAVNETNVVLPPLRGEPSAELAPTSATSTLLLICVYYRSPLFTMTQVGGAQCRSIVHNIVCTIEVVHNVGSTNPKSLIVVGDVCSHVYFKVDYPDWRCPHVAMLATNPHFVHRLV